MAPTLKLHKVVAALPGVMIFLTSISFNLLSDGLPEIRRLDDAMRQVLAQMRLVFAAMNDPRTFHQPYLAHNRELVELLDAGRWAQAEESLLAYLETAESQLLTALAA